MKVATRLRRQPLFGPTCGAALALGLAASGEARADAIDPAAMVLSRWQASEGAAKKLDPTPAPAQGPAQGSGQAPGRSAPAQPPARLPASPFPAPISLGPAAGDLTCLAAAVYYEAGNQPRAGQEAVAQVVLNRTRRAGYPASVCGVVLQGGERRTGCQFTFVCDGSLRRRPSAAGWLQARSVAQAALDGRIDSPVGGALNYHADYVRPYWSSSLVRVAQIGAHIFYRPAGPWASAPGMAPGPPRPQAPAPAAAAPPGTAAAPPPTIERAFLPWGLKLTTPGASTSTAW